MSDEYNECVITAIHYFNHLYILCYFAGPFVMVRVSMVVIDGRLRSIGCKGKRFYCSLHLQPQSHSLNTHTYVHTYMYICSWNTLTRRDAGVRVRVCNCLNTNVRIT